MKIKKILASLLIIFVLYCALWSAYVTLRYKPFCDKLGIEYTNLQQNVTFRDGDFTHGFTYDVHKPYFPFWSGNISVFENVTDDDIGNVCIYFIFWPKGIRSYEYALFINDVTEESVDMHIVSLDNDLNPTEYYTDKGKVLYDQYIDRIEQLYKLSYERWGVPKK